MEAAISGDEDATRRLDEMGLWEAFLLGAQNGRPLLDHAAHILSIERASSAPQHAVEQGNFKDAASLLAKDELLSMYLWPEAFSLIESAQTLDSLLLLRASVALEVQLSILAAMDVQSGLAESIVQRVMPRADQPGWNPTKLLFTYVLKENGLSTIQALYEHKPLNGQRLELSTLKRWSAGSHFPNQVWFGPIVKALWGDANYAPAWNHYWAAKHLNYVGYLAQTFSEAARKLEGTDNEAKYRPWPHYPFGYSCFEDWAQARFPVWKTYHHHRRVQP
ncbi:MAG: hypothetical protein EG825_01880 [Rhodocyclaceae bacterium]|nr:hypothetical protein [Rhodocyclaceae bacterium]